MKTIIEMILGFIVIFTILFGVAALVGVGDEVIKKMSDITHEQVF